MRVRAFCTPPLVYASLFPASCAPRILLICVFWSPSCQSVKILCRFSGFFNSWCASAILLYVTQSFVCSLVKSSLLVPFVQFVIVLVFLGLVPNPLGRSAIVRPKDMPSKLQTSFSRFVCQVIGVWISYIHYSQSDYSFYSRRHLPYLRPNIFIIFFQSVFLISSALFSCYGLDIPMRIMLLMVIVS